MQELRCDFKMHGVVIDDHTIEIKCNSRFHEVEPGTVVLHRFDLRSGELIQTNLFKEIRSTT